MNLNEYLNTLKGKSLVEANKVTEELCGIIDFFESEEYIVAESLIQENKVEYGDWQTNFELACRVCLLIKEQGITPDIIIEPTCGTGTFILASIIVFGDSAKKIYGIEIYKPYLIHSKFRLLEYALKNPGVITSKIHLFHQSIFGFNFDDLHISQKKNILIIGNPPWVTNSKLSEINSKNLPQKSNFKKINGIEAITGKANFDIAEYISYQLLDYFHNQNSCLALLIKKSVAKNIVYEQKKERYKIKNMTLYSFNAKKEFDVSVAACLFIAKLGQGRSKQCKCMDLYSLGQPCYFGWTKDCFVADISDYQHYASIDGKCQLTWWSGMKHDCSKVMELSKKEGKFYNKMGEVVDIEPDLIYPILKSSDLKGNEINCFRRYIIVTQRCTSDNTDIIKDNQPKTYEYLETHSEWFKKRGSIIYKNRPKYCIFGIGPYSFKKYKIAIAGLYNTTLFSFVQPLEGKNVMLDDTCYLMGFDNRDVAKCFLKILNSDIVQRFMKSLVFHDAKRSINKDLLMRIDLEKAAKLLFNKSILSKKEYELSSNYLATFRRRSSNRQLELF
ncbi:hypothetical protein [Prevotella melaninogenica]|uniref:SAM-dependent methyltransferase n=1 Tax=Prevotella melaninogenica TaxID=28132 RepID=A0A7D4JJQ8_9BACT|nr:hypothetical protein [Prevotella melaninogenica]EFC73337.1 hypothetical protein HMPREF0660_01193 [Prevotella melaninogenica D18]QKH89017.1 SAM-dependent methyltransferase [Prevotella melaninogenica]